MTADWRVRQLGRRWCVYSDSREAFHVSVSGRYRPRGAVIHFKSNASAQRRADQMNKAVTQHADLPLT